MPFSTDPVTLPDENGEPETWFFVHTDPEGNPLPDQSGEHVSGGASSSTGGGLVDGSVTIGDAKKKGKGKTPRRRTRRAARNEYRMPSVVIAACHITDPVSVIGE